MSSTAISERTRKGLVNNSDAYLESFKAMSSYLNGEIPLPLRPFVGWQAIEELASGSEGIIGAAELISQDPVLALHLFQTANGEDFRHELPTYCIHESIERIGTFEVTSGLFDLINASQDSQYQVKDDTIWKRAVATAHVAKTLGRPLGLSKHAFACGLLHNIGQLLLCSASPNAYQEVTELAKSKRWKIRQAEQSYFGMNHNSLGGKVLMSFGMPKSIVDAVRWYNRIGIAPNLTPAAYTNACLISVSSQLVDSNGLVKTSRKHSQTLRATEVARLRIAPAELPTLLKGLNDQIAALTRVSE